MESLALQEDDVEPVEDLTMPPQDKMDKKLSTVRFYSCRVRLISQYILIALHNKL